MSDLGGNNRRIDTITFHSQTSLSVLVVRPACYLSQPGDTWPAGKVEVQYAPWDMGINMTCVET